MRNVFIATFLSLTALVWLPAETIEHEVQSGETLYSISRRYGITVQELSEVNEIGSPDLLLPGTLLTVARRYRVQPGDTLYGIARSEGVTVAELQAMNELDTSTIVVGMRLNLPLRRPEKPATESPERVAGSDETAGAGERDTSGAADADNEESVPARRIESIPVALSLDEPISFAEGGGWPVAGRRSRLQGKLPGVMIRADRGAAVTAIAGGRVVYAGPHSSFGNVVFIQSSQGYIYVYGGQESVRVTVGEAVEAGAVVGTVGVNPTDGNPALYFSVWRNDAFVDPETAPRG
jgi:murein DD-endopeptidase MepM/ murein hydrolase activator NlpD